MMFEATRRAMVSFGALAMAAAARNPNDSATEIVDLERFGVNPSNNDNSAALQTAFDSAAAKNGPVFVLPAGKYRVSRPLRIHHPMTLLGTASYDLNSRACGSVIAGEAFSAPLLACEPADGDRLRGLCISGVLFDCGHRTNGIAFRGCADFAVARVGVRASTGFGIELRNSWDAAIVDAFVSECGTADARTGAIDITGEPFADNSNSLHFIASRVESSRGPSLIIHSALPGSGPNNNIQFVACKFHHPASDRSTPPTPNLVLQPAEAISFHGGQIFDAGRGFPVIEFGIDRSVDAGYAFFGCDIDVRVGDALLGGQFGLGHRFFGCTFRADPGTVRKKVLHRVKSEDVRRLKDLNNLYRIAT